jgi:hypothetical protein
VRKGEELKAPRYASATASCDDHVTIYNIIPNTSQPHLNNQTPLDLIAELWIKNILYIVFASHHDFMGGGQFDNLQSYT